MVETELKKHSGESFEDISGDGEHKSYKLYNFRRPDKFSKDNLRALRDIHREFSKAISLILSGYLRMRVEIEIVSVDQLTYEEFVRSMPSPISVGVFEFEPLSDWRKQSGYSDIHRPYVLKAYEDKLKYAKARLNKEGIKLCGDCLINFTKEDNVNTKWFKYPFEGINFINIDYYSDNKNKLNLINDRVNERLDQNFEKTNKTFTNILERLSRIDEAQKKIDTLSNDIVSLQSVLTDKKTRGTFGEVNLEYILNNAFGTVSSGIYKIQHKFIVLF